MHTINYISELNILTIYGGRDDKGSQSNGGVVLSDVWILKLDRLEYLKLKLGGKLLSTGRFSHSSLVCGSQLIVIGGQNEKFGIRKDIECVELD